MNTILFSTTIKKTHTHKKTSKNERDAADGRTGSVGFCLLPIIISSIRGNLKQKQKAEGSPRRRKLLWPCVALCDRAGRFLNRRLVTAKHPFSGAIGSAGVEIDGCPQNSRARMTCFADQEISDKTCISCNSIPSRDIQCTRPGFYRSFRCMLRDDFYVCRRIARGVGSGWCCRPRSVRDALAIAAPSRTACPRRARPRGSLRKRL